MDWIFLIKIVVLGVFLRLCIEIYRSKWLYSNKKDYMPDLSSWPSFFRPLAENFFNEGVVFYFLTIVFGLLFITGVSILFIIFGDALKSFEERLSKFSFLIQILLSAGLIVVCFVIYGLISKKHQKK